MGRLVAARNTSTPWERRVKRLDPRALVREMSAAVMRASRGAESRVFRIAVPSGFVVGVGGPVVAPAAAIVRAKGQKAGLAETAPRLLGRAARYEAGSVERFRRTERGSRRSSRTSRVRRLRCRPRDSDLEPLRTRTAMRRSRDSENEKGGKPPQKLEPAAAHAPRRR